MRLDLQSFLPVFVLVDSAKQSDPKHARAVCLGLSAGEIVIFDRAYVDFAHLFELAERGVFWVTRTKTNLRFRVVKRRLKKNTNPKILADDEVEVLNEGSRKKYPRRMRRVRALVEVDGEEREMEFSTLRLKKPWDSIDPTPPAAKEEAARILKPLFPPPPRS
jgi:hypothetical protein